MPNYCKKSSLDGIATAIKRASTDSTPILFPDEFAARISNIELIELQSNPNIVLHKSNKTYTLPAGRYTGGGVSVIPEEKTVAPSNASQSITASTNRALSKVTVSAIPLFQIATGTIAAGISGQSSVSISGLSFRPSGAAIIQRYGSFGSGIVVGVAHEKPGGNYGVTNGTAPGGLMTKGISLGANSITITAPFEGDNDYIIWGK